jgi:ABC-type transport system substrate-binding protein
VAAGRAGRLRAQLRIRAARRHTERLDWRQEGVPRQGRLAIHPRPQTKRKQLADEVQKVALSEVTYVPWGEWVQPTAFRKNVRDVLKFGAPIFWNVRVS